MDGVVAEVDQSEFVFRPDILGLGCPLEEHLGPDDVLVHTQSDLVDLPQEVRGVEVVLQVGLVEPCPGGLVILGNALTPGVHESEEVLRFGVSQPGFPDEGRVGIRIRLLVLVADDELRPFHGLHCLGAGFHRR